MSSFDERGRGINWHPTAAAAGVACELCDTPISKTPEGKLYEYNGGIYCRTCLLADVFKYKGVGYCENCTGGTDARSKYFVKTAVYPVGGRELCEACTLETITRVIDENDPQD